MTAAAVDLISQAQAVCRQRIADAKKATPWYVGTGYRDLIKQHIANHSPDKVLPWWEWALEQLGEFDEEARWTPEDMRRNNRAVSLATAIVGSHDG